MLVLSNLDHDGLVPGVSLVLLKSNVSVSWPIQVLPLGAFHLVVPMNGVYVQGTVHIHHCGINWRLAT